MPERGGGGVERETTLPNQPAFNVYFFGLYPEVKVQMLDSPFQCVCYLFQRRGVHMFVCIPSCGFCLFFLETGSHLVQVVLEPLALQLLEDGAVRQPPHLAVPHLKMFLFPSLLDFIAVCYLYTECVKH